MVAVHLTYRICVLALFAEKRQSFDQILDNIDFIATNNANTEITKRASIHISVFGHKTKDSDEFFLR